eukprot:2481410-Alexandrium_andersonii.AAC.1
MDAVEAPLDLVDEPLIGPVRVARVELFVIVHHPDHALGLAQLGLKEGPGNARSNGILLAMEHAHPRVVERLQLHVVGVLRRSDAVE